MTDNQTPSPRRRRRMRRSVWLPCVLVLYLGIMSYVGLPIYRAGNYLHYFGVIGVTLVVIIMLHIFLKKRENIKR